MKAKRLEADGRDVKQDPVCLSSRWTLALVGFFGFVFLYAFRVNLSLAMVWMVKREPNNQTTSSPSYQGEFHWDDLMQGYILSSFFYGYIITQVPGGILASRFGGKHVLGVSMLVNVIATLLLPVLTRVHVSFLIILRVTMGLASGFVFPAMNVLWSKWAPPLERTKLMAVCYVGTSIGNIVTLNISGVLCDTGINGGWPLIFYFFGGTGFLWWLWWCYVVYSCPDDHPRISISEREYIYQSMQGSVCREATERSDTPWKSIFTSGPVWAIIIAMTMNSWGIYTMLTCLPQFMSDVLEFDIKENGFFSSLPYIALFISTMILGVIIDLIREKNILSTTNARRMAQSIGFIPPACIMVGLGYVKQRGLAVALLTLSIACTGGSAVGYGTSHQDIAPRYAGVIYGIANTVSTVPGMVSPVVVGALTADKSNIQDSWRKVFYICASLYAFGAVVYLVLTSGEIQPWAMSENTDKREPDLSRTKHAERCVNNVAFGGDPKVENVRATEKQSFQELKFFSASQL